MAKAQEPFFQPPARFELTLEHVSAPRNEAFYTIRPLIPDPEHEFHSAWQLSGPREATLVWSTGFVGVEAVANVDRNTGNLNGKARTFTDVGSPPDTANFVARRTRC
jgi:hypothetical protein